MYLGVRPIPIFLIDRRAWYGRTAGDDVANEELGGATACANSDEVDSMFSELESRSRCSVAQGAFKCSFGACWERDVDHRAAFAADEVVMMVVGNEFAELVVGAAFADVDTGDEAGLLKDGEVAV
jgi:hypothetical protein